MVYACKTVAWCLNIVITTMIEEEFTILLTLSCEEKCCNYCIYFLCFFSEKCNVLSGGEKKKIVPADSDLQFWICSSPSSAAYQQEKWREQQFTAADVNKWTSLLWISTGYEQPTSFFLFHVRNCLWLIVTLTDTSQQEEVKNQQVSFNFWPAYWMNVYWPQLIKSAGNICHFRQWLKPENEKQQ